MEAVGAIASIAGILSLTGHAMNGIIILIQILEHASDLIAKLRAAVLHRQRLCQSLS